MKKLIVTLIITVIALCLLGTFFGIRSYLKEERSKALTQSQISEPVIWAANPIQVEAPDSAWTDFYKVPSGRFMIMTRDNESAEVIFSNNKYYLLNDRKSIDFGHTSGKFKFRGVRKKVVVYIYHQE